MLGISFDCGYDECMLIVELDVCYLVTLTLHYRKVCEPKLLGCKVTCNH